MIVFPINKTNKILTISPPRDRVPQIVFFPDFGSLPNHIQKLGLCPRDRCP